MKFINYLQDIAGVAIFPMISLIMFFVFFIVLAIFVARLTKKQISTFENIPLDKTDSSTSL